MPLGATDLGDAIAKSVSGEMNLEHIFFEIPTTQQYEIWVHQFNSPFGDVQDYALAWWTASAISLTSKGDFDGSGVVDDQDYLVWRNAFGTSNAAADANGNGIVDSADYVIWRKNFGTVAGAGIGLASVPEPSAICLALLGMLCCLAKRTKKAGPMAGFDFTSLRAKWLSPC
jgi:hypothetical protein